VLANNILKLQKRTQSSQTQLVFKISWSILKEKMNKTYPFSSVQTGSKAVPKNFLMPELQTRTDNPSPNCIRK